MRLLNRQDRIRQWQFFHPVFPRRQEDMGYHFQNPVQPDTGEDTGWQAAHLHRPGYRLIHRDGDRHDHRNWETGVLP